ncbi:MAG: hypothetical protein KC438_08525 [Thermomicrobiales bacterium]|nr:hypothetical protein [Thermomicrobiales bacterium]MCO5223502.1 hypothetical protein [Thermomicrobiales bacterium]
MQYRVSRLESLMKVDLTEPEVRFKLELLVRILEFNEREQAHPHQVSW